MNTLAHPELGLVQRAAAYLAPDKRAAATLYTSGISGRSSQRFGLMKKPIYLLEMGFFSAKSRQLPVRRCSRNGILGIKLPIACPNKRCDAVAYLGKLLASRVNGS
ncbi:hypothetical protein [Hymenobacter lapidarius]|uniref:hypothetical protein n=1 Tax=Hymenobacter lapidarius TaxID=1908237 RepID=UPI000F77B516|nr:hypothetical protein [Hymenobacter lapidarius]